MSDLIWDVFVLLKWFEDKFHKLTCRGIDSLWLLIELIVYWLYCLSHDKLQGDIDNKLQVLVGAFQFSSFDTLRSHPIEYLIKLLKNVVSGLTLDNIVYHLFLCIENDVSHFTEVLNYNLSLIHFVEEDLSRVGHKDTLWVLEELFN